MTNKRRKKKSEKIEKKLSPIDQINAAIDANEWEKAETLLKQETTTNKNPHLYYYLGYVYRCVSDSKNNKLVDALSQQEIALKLLDNKNQAGWIYYEMGKIYDDDYYCHKDKEKALEYFQKAITCDETAYDAYELIARLYCWNEVDKKIEIYKKGIEKFPHIKSCYISCFLCLYYHKKNHLEAERILQKAIENNIKSASIYFHLGEIKIEQVMFDEAFSYYEKILDFENDSNLHARIYFILALIHIKKDSYDEAEKFLLVALKQNSDKYFSNPIYLGLILCSQMAETTERTIEFIDKITINKPQDEFFDFCGRAICGLWSESFFYDDSELNIDYSDIVTKMIDSLENIKNQFDKDINQKFYLIKALIFEKDEKYEESILYLEKASCGEDCSLLWDIYKNAFQSMLYDDKYEHIKGKALTQYFKLLKTNIKNNPKLCTVLKETIMAELVPVLWELDKYKQIAEICSFYDHSDLDKVLFEAAYSYNETGSKETAKSLYEQYLDNTPDSGAVLNNLANLYQDDGRIKEAIDLYEKALAIDSDDKHAAKNLQIALSAKKEKDKQYRVQQVALTHWPSLDNFKKRMLLVLNSIESFSNFAELANLCKIEEKWTIIHYKKLVELGMVIDNGDHFVINPKIKPLIDRENSHAVAINIIRSDESINFKPIFNSKQEFDIYRLMIGLFPNHLVFPNMSLQTIFTYERMQAILDSELFKFYLLTSVDICIVSTANYLPIICFEVDSPYHDAPEQISRDQKKNQIFEYGGTPLIRLRLHGKPSDLEIREQIIKSIQELGKELDPLEKHNELILQLLKNVN